MGKHGSKELRAPDPRAQPSATTEDNLVAVFSPEFAPESTTISLDEFEVVKEIGHGSFGTVHLVRKRSNGKVYAMKMLDKKNIIATDAIQQSKAEQALQNIAGKHPLIVNLRYAFQTNDHLCIVIDFVGGGDLFDHLKADRRFDESRARLYSAEIYVAISYMHSLNIVYRDLKAENVLLDGEGHVRLADFGLAKELSALARTSTVCGTAEYMAPEIVDTSVPYSFEADWWSYGVFIYVMLYGKYPFSAQTRAQLNNMVATKPISFPRTVPVSNEAKNLIRKLLHKDPARRLMGDDIAEHPWFAGIDWDRVANRGYDPPFKPTLHPEIEEILSTAPNPEFRRMSSRRAAKVAAAEASASGGSSGSDPASSPRNPPPPPSSSGSSGRRRRRHRKSTNSTSSGRRRRRRRRRRASSSSSSETASSPPPAAATKKPNSTPATPNPVSSRPVFDAALHVVHSEGDAARLKELNAAANKKTRARRRRRRRHREKRASSSSVSSYDAAPLPPAPLPDLGDSGNDHDDGDDESRSVYEDHDDDIDYNDDDDDDIDDIEFPSGDIETGDDEDLIHHRTTSTIDTKSIRSTAVVVEEPSLFNPTISRPAPSRLAISPDISPDISLDLSHESGSYYSEAPPGLPAQATPASSGGSFSFSEYEYSE